MEFLLGLLSVMYVIGSIVFIVVFFQAGYSFMNGLNKAMTRTRASKKIPVDLPYLLKDPFPADLDYLGTAEELKDPTTYAGSRATTATAVLANRHAVTQAMVAYDMLKIRERIAEESYVLTPEYVQVPIFFKLGEPTNFEEFGLQRSITDMLDIQIRALPINHSRMRPQMFLGPAGLGKTLLAKVCAEELRKRNVSLGLPEPTFIEVFPADMGSVADLDAVIRRAAEAPAAVVFIDEVHGLAGTHAHKLYELLENGRYPFHGDASPTELPHVTLLAATTDYGKLHSALKRRWVKHYMEAATEQQLVDILHRRGDIAPSAARRIMERTKFGGAPWEAIELFELAKSHALATRPLDTQVNVIDVNWVFEQQEIDTLGLRKFDRNVIEALRERRRNIGGELVHGASESDTCVLAGVDRTEYRETIRPRLMARGLLEIRSGVGQVLTDKALKAYPRNYVPEYV